MAVRAAQIAAARRAPMPGTCCEPSVGACEFECFERVDVQGFVDLTREIGTDARHHLKQLLGIDFAAQPLQLRPATRD